MSHFLLRRRLTHLGFTSHEPAPNHAARGLSLTGVSWFWAEPHRSRGSCRKPGARAVGLSPDPALGSQLGGGLFLLHGPEGQGHPESREQGVQPRGPVRSRPHSSRAPRRHGRLARHQPGLTRKRDKGSHEAGHLLGRECHT